MHFKTHSVAISLCSVLPFSEFEGEKFLPEYAFSNKNFRQAKI